MAEARGFLMRALPPIAACPRFVAVLLLALVATASATVALAGELAAARLWSSPDYTRITIESRDPIRYKVFSVADPDRLVVDVETPRGFKVLETLAAQLPARDPFIGGLRVGRFKPGVVRLVLDLNTAVQPQTYQLKPVGDYGHRLVLDVYPAEAPDPLMALLTQGAGTSEAPAGPANTAASDQNTERKSATAADAGAAPAASPEDRKGPRKAPAQAPTASGPAGGLQMERLVTVAIDAGHGGEDPGAKGHKGTFEKDVTLAVARKLKEAIDAQPNMRGVLTRDGDYFIPLHHRVIKARKIQADLFVSVHADAFIKPNAKGSSVFALSERGATSAAARWLAKRENDADLIGGVNLDVADPNLKKVLLDLSQTATINDSLKLGRAVLSEIAQINTLHKAEVEQAGFAVLKAPDIPSILVETAFISNPSEEKRLNDDAYQTRLAKAIATGIQAYFAKNPPLARARTVRSDTPGIDDAGSRRRSTASTDGGSDGLQLAGFPSTPVGGSTVTRPKAGDKLQVVKPKPRKKAKQKHHGVDRPAKKKKRGQASRKARKARTAAAAGNKASARACADSGQSTKAAARTDCRRKLKRR